MADKQFTASAKPSAWPSGPPQLKRAINKKNLTTQILLPKQGTRPIFTVCHPPQKLLRKIAKFRENCSLCVFAQIFIIFFLDNVSFKIYCPLSPEPCIIMLGLVTFAWVGPGPDRLISWARHPLWRATQPFF